MRTVNLHPVVAAILLTLLAMGMVGVFVAVPIALIAWAWNAIVPLHTSLPEIGLWQAALLYADGLLCLYISGLIKVEVKAEKLE